jgi:hypothetical protein
MAGTIIGTPDSPPTVDADWDKVISNYVVGGKGQNSISLSEWASANTTKPAIEAGSTIEVNGSFAEFTSTVIGDDGSLVTGTIYLYIDITTSPGDALPKFTNSVPVWDAAKGGWYSGNNRYTGHFLTWDGAISYTDKRQFFVNKKGSQVLIWDVDGEVIFSGPLSGVTDITASGDITGNSIDTDNAKVRIKYMTGTTDSSGEVTIAHGITNGDTAIMSVIASYNPSGITWFDVAIGGSGDGVVFDNINIYLRDTLAISDPVRFVIFYRDI